MKFKTDGLEHTPATVMVFQSTDYKKFRNIQGNRSLNELKIKRIIKEIETGNDVLDHVPILVSENKKSLDIIDGQHRFEIAKLLKRPVHYIVRPEISLLNIAKVNSNVEKWKPVDFINCYIATGNDNYQKLSNYIEDYQIPLGVSLMLLSKGMLKHDGSGGNTWNTLKAQFESGTFEVKYMKQAKDIAEACAKFRDFKGWNSRGFVIAICKVLAADVVDFEEFSSKVAANIKDLQSKSNYKEYLTALENIYNKGFSKRRVIF